MSSNALSFPLTIDRPALIERSPQEDHSNLNRQDFPEGFLFGTATSAYQVEGAAYDYGKSRSIWDDFTTRYPQKITDGSNGIVACDMYHRFKEDIAMMKNLGFDVYRFSIAWTRILPGGRVTAGINREGIKYYNELIDTVISHGMQPCVTIFHWDLPDILQKEYGGFLSEKIIQDFKEYAEICFIEFGDRVKWWCTINEPWTYAVSGYARGFFPPGINTNTPEQPLKNINLHFSINEKTHTITLTPELEPEPIPATKIGAPNPAKAVYSVGRNLLLAHAEAVHLYRQKYQGFQGGKIGIVCNCRWFVPLNPHSKKDQIAAHRALDFMIGWFLSPVLYGHYPKSMENYVPDGNLQPFSHEESEKLRDSIDYLGLNYYTANYISDDPNKQGIGYDADMKLEFHYDRNGKPIGEPSGASWLYIVPWGFYELLGYLKRHYPKIPYIYITENGVADKNDIKETSMEARVDTRRTKYYQDHLYYLLMAINELNVDVRGYIQWAWCDNFEWASGYSDRFGINYVDYKDHQTRVRKYSAMWFAKFLNNSNKTLLLEKHPQKRGIEEEIEDDEPGPYLKKLRGS